MKISVIGTGYAGLVTGACFAETGNDVICIDSDKKKVESLQRAEIPFFEPGLEGLVSRNMREERLQFTSDSEVGLKDAVISFICVGTPSNEDGSANLDAVFEVVDLVSDIGSVGSILAMKSTVPIGTCDQVRECLDKKGRKDIHVASNPEFLREGSAVQDCLLPDRVVVGTENVEVADTFRDLYASFVRTGYPILIMDLKSAEMAKYASNSFLAARISFMNEMAMICERVGADVNRVREAIGADNRIGPRYLFPSVGFGGSCFPKDVRALIWTAQAKKMNPPMLQATLDVNDAQKDSFVRRVISHFGGANGAKDKKVAIWGLAFKAKTDDIRESPALHVVDGLLKAKTRLTVYDPEAMKNVRSKYGEKLSYARTPFDALKDADALCVLTEWNQFRHPDFGRIKKAMKSPVVFDGRNLYDPGGLAKMGFQYFSIGRPTFEA